MCVFLLPLLRSSFQITYKFVVLYKVSIGTTSFFLTLNQKENNKQDKTHPTKFFLQAAVEEVF